MKAVQKTKNRPGRPRKQDLALRDATKTIIMQSALELFAANGFDGTSTVAVARRAGLAQSVLHYHFTSKELLWKATIKDLFKRINEKYPLTINDSEDACIKTELKRVIRRHMEASSHFPEMARIVIIEGSFETERLQWLTETYYRGTYKFLERVLNRAREAGLIGNAPNFLLAQMIYAAGSVLFSVSPMIRTTHGIDISNPMQRELAVETGLEVILNGVLLSRPDDPSLMVQARPSRRP